MRTRAEIEAVARRITMSMMYKDVFDELSASAPAWDAEELALVRSDRAIIAALYGPLLARMDALTAGRIARTEWLTSVLIEEFGVRIGRDALMPAIETIRYTLDMLPDDESRYELLSLIAAGYCRHCGGREEHGGCPCMRDE